MTLTPHAVSGRSSFLRGTALVVLVASLAGCSLWSGGGSAKPAPADLGANVAVLGVRQAWTARVGNVAGLPLDVHTLGNVVTVASSDGVVAATIWPPAAALAPT